MNDSTTASGRLQTISPGIDPILANRQQPANSGPSASTKISSEGNVID
jgi:hypothetical protein